MESIFPYHEFNGPLHRAWKHDRAMRQKLPLAEAWRGSIGLALMWQNVDRDFECQGNRVFYANDNLSWLALRDIPVGHFPGCRTMDRRDVNLASVTVADLSFGLPKLSFRMAPTWDFRRMPYSTAQVRYGSGAVDTWTATKDTLNSEQRPREFAIFNELSAAMTRQAFSGCNSRGRWIRPAWALSIRPKDRLRFTPPRTYFPRPFLGFPACSPALQRAELTRHECIQVKMHPGLRFYSMWAATPIVKQVKPAALVWDCASLEPFINPELEAAIFPPLPCPRWDHFRFNVMDIDVDTGVCDPRFCEFGSAFRYEPNYLDLKIPA